MAHLANSQIQSHSVGPIFPYVIARQEIDGSPFWYVIQPNGAEVGPWAYYDNAYKFAAECVAVMIGD